MIEKMDVGDIDDGTSDIKIIYEKKSDIQNNSSKLPSTQKDNSRNLPQSNITPIRVTNIVCRNNEPAISARVKRISVEPAISTASVKRILVENNSSVPVIDLTDDADDEQRIVGQDSSTFLRELLKLYPSLGVIIIPMCNRRTLLHPIGKNNLLIMKMKEIHNFTAEELMIWLFRKSLISTDKFCTVHRNPDLTYKKMKLGTYSNRDKTHHSAGFVWLNECCSVKPVYVSVFDKTIFDCSQAPLVILNLIYHWCCQSNIQLVMNELKVTQIFIEQFYTKMRAVCTASVHEKSCKLGGLGSIVELAVIFMGVNHKSQNTKSLKAIIIGLLDTSSMRTRILAIEPVPEFKNDATALLSSIKDVVHSSSTIVTDSSVDKNILSKIGFSEVYNILTRDNRVYTNAQIASYVRRIPRLFYNTLNSLSIHQIQQFMNELVWRERWGATKMDSFQQILEDIAEQTKVNSNFDHLNWTLDEIACQPHKNWSYSMWKSNLHPDQDCDVLIENSSSAQNIIPTSLPQSMNKTVLASTDGPKALITYYYGTLFPKKQITSENRSQLKCSLCKTNTSTTPKLVEHLIKQHVLDQFEPDKTEICLDCFRTFSTRYNLKTHLAAVHKKKKGALACLICEEVFTDSSRLVNHMKRTHCELDLPYRCGICGFRTSEHCLIVSHFNLMHAYTTKIWCPLCFKLVNIERDRDANIAKYQKHIARHLMKPFIRKCSKCVLHFIHTGKLREHEIKDHNSCKDIPGVIRYRGEGPLICHQATNAKQKECSALKRSNKTLSEIRRLYRAAKVKTVKINELRGQLECLECEGLLSDHVFDTQYFCEQCKYTTWCRQAVEYHICKCHLKLHRYNEYKESIVRNRVKCGCGFESRYGNKLAKHVALCKTELFKKFNVNILNTEIKQAIVSGSVAISQLDKSPDVLLSLGLFRLG